MTAALSVAIPAADLSGGTQRQTVTGEEAELADFTPVLENDEVFVLDAIQGRAFAGGPTTATAEGAFVVEYDIGTASDVSAPHLTSPFWISRLDKEEGIADINVGQDGDSESIWVGQLAGTPGALDTANNLHGGSDWDRQDIWRQFGGEHVYDRDDELYAPLDIHVDNVSDHAVEFDLVVLLEGRTIEDC